MLRGTTLVTTASCADRGRTHMKHYSRPYFALACALSFCAFSSGGVAAPVIIDWSTEDDFSTPLVNGQSVSTFVDQQPTDTVFEFGNLFNLSTKQLGSDGHLGAAIFDSTVNGPNDDGGVQASAEDPDLLIDRGNLLILQNDQHPGSSIDPTYGLIFDIPNDENRDTDDGSIVFDFLVPVELESMVLVDVDEGGLVIVTMTDGTGNQREYTVPAKWTNDLTVSPAGFDTLMLNTLSPQAGEGGGGDATATEDLGFDPLDVRSLEVAILAVPGPSSVGIDDLVFVVVPEPSTAALCFVGAIVFGTARRFRRVSRV